MKAEEICNVLERISKLYSVDSAEYVALKEAAQTILISHEKCVEERVSASLIRYPLSESERDHLARMGIQVPETDGA